VDARHNLSTVSSATVERYALRLVPPRASARWRALVSSPGCRSKTIETHSSTAVRTGPNAAGLLTMPYARRCSWEADASHSCREQLASREATSPADPQLNRPLVFRRLVDSASDVDRTHLISSQHGRSDLRGGIGTHEAGVRPRSSPRWVRAHDANWTALTIPPHVYRISRTDRGARGVAQAGSAGWIGAAEWRVNRLLQRWEAACDRPDSNLIYYRSTRVFTAWIEQGRHRWPSPRDRRRHNDSTAR